ncbi:MAG: hypothetical protein K8T10_10955 [Candidatus Eremiobacteraeota bacterium]|nr:hypothetical protein [Candidatus Eremiobacteraeota bacterium]
MIKNSKIIFSLIFSIALLLFSFILLHGCTSKNKEKTVRIGFIGKANNINPLKKPDDISKQVISAVFAGLTRWNDKWEEEPVLCEKVPTLKNGGLKTKGKYLVQCLYSMKKESKWSDGSPLTVYDALFAYQMSYSPIFKKYNPEMLDVVKKVTIPGGNSIAYVMKRTYRGISLIPLPQESLENSLMSAERDNVDEVFLKNTSFSGAFQLESFSPRKILLKRNSNHPVAGSGFQKIEIIGYNREIDRIADLKAGKIDLAYNPSYETVREVQNEKNLKTDIVKGAGQLCLVANMKSSQAGNINLRKAIICVTDRKSMSVQIFGKPDFAPISWLSPRHPAAEDFLKKYSLSPKKAKNLINRMGFKKNKSQKYEKDEILLYPSVVLSGDDPLQYRTAQFLKKSMKKIGVDIEIKPYPEDVYQKMINEKDFPDFAIVRLETYPWMDPSDFFSRKSIPSGKSNDSQKNYGGWVNEENEKLCAAYRATLDPEDRFKILKKQQKIVAENLPIIPLLNIAEIVICNNKLKNIKPRGFGAIMWNVEEWDIVE